VIGARQHYPPVRSLRDPGRGLRPAPGGFSTRRYADVPFDSFGEARLNPALAYPMERVRPEPVILRGVEAPELSSLEEGWECAGTIDRTGAAGQLALLQLRNPGDRHIRVIVRGLIISSPTSQNMAVHVGADTGTNVERGWRRTSAGQPRGAAELREDSVAAASGNRIFQIQVLANSPLPLTGLAIALDAGDTLTVFAGTVATTMRAVFLGREYDESTRGAA